MPVTKRKLRLKCVGNVERIWSGLLVDEDHSFLGDPPLKRKNPQRADRIAEGFLSLKDAVMATETYKF